MTTCPPPQDVPDLVIALGISVFLLLSLVGVLVTVAVQRAGVKRVVHVPGTPEWEKP